MKQASQSCIFSLGFAVMLLLSVSVHPVMAADATKTQMDSFSVEDIEALSVDELVSDNSGSFTTMSASSEEGFQEYQQGKVHARAKDPLADQQRPVAGSFSASSYEAGDPADAQIAGAIATMGREGYDPTGQTRHRYQLTLESEKFRNIDPAQRDVMDTKGLHADAMDPIALTMQEEVTYYFFTNTEVNATRFISVSQMVDNEGTLIGERNVMVSEDIVYVTGDEATERGFSLSGDVEKIAMIPFDTESPLVAGAAGEPAISMSDAKTTTLVIAVGIVLALFNIPLITTLVFFLPDPDFLYTCGPDQGYVPLTIHCTDQSTGTSVLVNKWWWDFGDGQQSTDTNPTHTYTSPGKYIINLNISDAFHRNFTLPSYGSIVVLSPFHDSSIVLFGSLAEFFEPKPDKYDYSRIGGVSAIRRTGEIETFKDSPGLTGSDWVQVTYGAAIKKDGTLVTWPYRSSGIANTYPATADKKYVAVSRFSEGDWLLAITEDSGGETHLELVNEGDKSQHPEISDQLPTGTGWTKISAGYTHALALKSDGTLVAWGKNNYHQLDLPADKKYTEISAGEYFSLGLIEQGTSTDTGPDVAVVGSGVNDYGQVSNMTSLPPGKYITVEAGTKQSAALDHDGTIRWGGLAWIGSALPTGSGYTDIVLGPDYGIAIRESADEIILSGPISPGKQMEGRKRGSGSTDTPTIPFGSTVVHTDHDITRIYGPDGSQLGWVNDKESEIVYLPDGSQSLAVNMIIIPNATKIDSTNDVVVTLVNASSGEFVRSLPEILTIVFQKPVSSSNIERRSTRSTYCTVEAPNWVEWATMSTSSLPNFFAFKTEWIIPNKPADTKVGDGTPGHERYLDTERTQVSTWNGIEGNGVLIQVVPVWNGYYTGSTDTYRNFDKAWSWAIWGRDKTHELTFLTEPASLNEGDVFDASYWISSSDAASTTWGVYGGKSGSEKLFYWKTSDLTKNNGVLEVAEEAYLLKQAGTAHSRVWDSKYFPSNTKFTNFDIQAGGGEPISPAFSGCLAKEWGQNISTLKTEIISGPPYEIILHTTR